MQPEIKALLDSEEPESSIVAVLLAQHGKDRGYMLRQQSMFATRLSECRKPGCEGDCLGCKSLMRGLLAIEKRIAALDAEQAPLLAGRVP